MNTKLEIFYAISQCNYPNAIQKEFITYLQENFAKTKSKLYLFARNPKVSKIFLLQTYIPGIFQGTSYDISILIYFPGNFPMIPPEVYLEKLGKIKINPQCTFYISDDTLKINYDLFFKWNNTFSALNMLIEELKHQFSFAFPIFNLPEGEQEFDYISGDCILQPSSLLEIDLPPLPSKEILANPFLDFAKNNKGIQNNIGPNNAPKPIQNNINNNRHNSPPIQQKMNINNQAQIIRNNTNQMNRNNPINKKDITRVQSFPHNTNNIVDGMKVMNINDNKKPIPPKIDDKVIKHNLLNLVLKNVLPKINREIVLNFNTTIRIEKLKNSIQSKFDKLSSIEKKSNELSMTVQNLEKDLDSYAIVLPEMCDLSDLSNLDKLLNIPLKANYEYLAKEKSLEELLVLIKKAYEKGTMDFVSCVKMIRQNSRTLFFMKYKNQSINLFNK